MVKLNIVDLIGSLCLEPLVDDSEFFFGDVKLEEVKDGSESSVGDEPGVRFVFVLEVRFDQKSSVSCLKSDSLQACLKLSFLAGVEHIKRVKD